MRAVQMLVRASNQGLIDPRSVSMIILVSDGDPTVGRTDAQYILESKSGLCLECFHVGFVV